MTVFISSPIMPDSPVNNESEDVVYYCRSCHSLYILFDDSIQMEGWDGSYCGKCQSTDIGQCTIDEWVREEEARKERKRIREWNRL